MKLQIDMAYRGLEPGSLPAQRVQVPKSDAIKFQILGWNETFIPVQEYV